MKQKYEAATHKIYTTTIDDYNQKNRVYQDSRTIQIAISLLSNREDTANNVLTATTTHIGITEAKEFHIKDAIICGGTSYQIDYAVEQGRFTRLFLTAIEEDCNGI